MEARFTSIRQYVPAALKSCWGWVPWLYENRPKRPGKPNIVPLNARTGRNKNTQAIYTWGTIHAAMRTAKQHGFPGIGFMFPGDYFALEIDACVDADTGAIDDMSQAILDALPSYAEYSVDGTGIHILCKGRLPRGTPGLRYGRIGLLSWGCCLPIMGEPVGAPWPLVDCTELMGEVITKFLRSV